jgi:methylglutaconyl-CoA hydratase
VGRLPGRAITPRFSRRQAAIAPGRRVTTGYDHGLSPGMRRMSHPLLQFRDGAVARLRLNRPQLHNAFDATVIAALTGALDSVARDPDIRVVVIEGEGASFSAGADLNWMRGMAAASEDENRDDSLALARLMRRLDELPKPTIARVHGPAFGGGVGLVAACDIAIGADTATFGLTETRLGLLPAVISPYVIAAIGGRNARRYFTTAERFDAAQAQRMGLLHEVVAADAIDAAVQQQVELLLKAGPIASAAAKALVRNVAAASGPVAIDAANADLIARLRVSPEGQEGIAAFLDKRNPAWSTK